MEYFVQSKLKNMYIVTEIVNDKMNGNNIQISIINESVSFVFNGYSYSVNVNLLNKKVNNHLAKIEKEK